MPRVTWIHLRLLIPGITDTWLSFLRHSLHVPCRPVSPFAGYRRLGMNRLDGWLLGWVGLVGGVGGAVFPCLPPELAKTRDDV